MCYNCLGHKTEKRCYSKRRCAKCNKTHHTMLHVEQKASINMSKISPILEEIIKRHYIPPASPHFGGTCKDETSDVRNKIRTVRECFGKENNSSARDYTRQQQPLLPRKRKINIQQQKLNVPSFCRKEMKRNRERTQERNREEYKGSNRNQYVTGMQSRKKEREREAETARPEDYKMINITWVRHRLKRSYDKRRSTRKIIMKDVTQVK